MHSAPAPILAVICQLFWSSLGINNNTYNTVLKLKIILGLTFNLCSSAIFGFSCLNQIINVPSGPVSYSFEILYKGVTLFVVSEQDEIIVIFIWIEKIVHF